MAKLAGDEKALVVVGERESRDDFRYVEMPVGEVLRSLASQEPFHEALYLKEYDLLRRLPALRADVRLPEMHRPGAYAAHLAWISQAGARTGYHFDIVDNVLVQIVGVKRVTCVAPALSEGMYQSDRFDRFARVSRVDGFSPDLGKYPLFARCREAEQTFELHPGDGLYIPRRWWHRAESLSPSISISGFMIEPPDLPGFLIESMLQALHALGLYKRGHCVCHATGQKARVSAST